MTPKDDATKYDTREGWLLAATELLNKVIAERTTLTPRAVRVSCGWPSSRGTASRNRTIGQCFPSEKDKVPQVFISPVLEHYANGENGSHGYGVLPTLAHELLHAYLPAGTGHKAPFAKAAKSLGLSGKPTSTFGPEDFIKDVCDPIIEKLGSYPHAALSADGWKKQGTRLLKVECPECGYIIRTTAKWLEVGTPTCPCGTVMEADLDKDERLETLRLKEQHQEFETKDGRFMLRCRTNGKVSQWFLIDFEHPGGARMTTIEDKYQGLDLIDSIREGLTTFDELEERTLNDGEGEHLAEDEVEEHDYAEEFEFDQDGTPKYIWSDLTPGERLFLIREGYQFTREGVTEEEYEEMERYREQVNMERKAA